MAAGAFDEGVSSIGNEGAGALGAGQIAGSTGAGAVGIAADAVHAVGGSAFCAGCAGSSLGEEAVTGAIAGTFAAHIALSIGYEGAGTFRTGEIAGGAGVCAVGIAADAIGAGVGSAFSSQGAGLTG